MMTREEVAEIITYCKEHKVSYKDRLAELNISHWLFYRSKAYYAAEQSADGKGAGEFIELAHSGSFVPAPSFAGRSRSRRKETGQSAGRLKSVEIRTNAGTAIRIQGGFTESELCSIIKACSGVQP